MLELNVSHKESTVVQENLRIMRNAPRHLLNTLIILLLMLFEHINKDLVRAVDSEVEAERF